RREVRSFGCVESTNFLPPSNTGSTARQPSSPVKVVLPSRKNIAISLWNGPPPERSSTITLRTWRASSGAGKILQRFILRSVLEPIAGRLDVRKGWNRICFFSRRIWIPRDARQQNKPLKKRPGKTSENCTNWSKLAKQQRSLV